MSSDEGEGIRNSDRNAVRRERDDESNKVILSERREASDAFVSNERQARMEDVILIVRIRVLGREPRRVVEKRSRVERRGGTKRAATEKKRGKGKGGVANGAAL